MKRKFILWPKANSVVVEEGELEAVNDHEVVVKNHYSAVSPGSESGWLASDVSHIVLGTTYPFIPGYSASGEIVEVGKDVKNYKVGDRVICNNVYGCHASHLKTTEDHLFKIPDNVSYGDAVFFNLGMTSIHTVRLSKARMGESLAIVGQGPIGLMATQAAKACGCYPIVTLEFEEDRRKESLKAGADISLDPRNSEEYNNLKTMLGGGAQHVIDLSGTNPGMNQAIDIAGPLSTVCFSSATMAPQTIDYGNFFIKGITLEAAFVNARMKEQYDDVNNFLLLTSRKQLTVPDYSNEIFEPEDAPDVYNRILNKDRTLKNPIFKWC